MKKESTSSSIVKGMSLWTASDLIDSRLTVYAQRSLLRLLKGSLVEQKVAADLITSVKTGDMEGVYVVNQVKPVQRAREIGTYWWQLIPKGVSIICMVEPKDRAPLLAFSIAAIRTDKRVDAGLMRGWELLMDSSIGDKMIGYGFSVSDQS